MCLKDMNTALKTAGVDNNSSWKNSRKTLRPGVNFSTFHVQIFVRLFLTTDKS